MEYYSNQISRLIEEFSRLPGIGSKSAQRLAFHVINMPLDQVEGLAKSIIDARKNVRYCKVCCTLTDRETCPICGNPDRDKKTIMVVETPRDLAAYEKTGKYNGVYHVLHGAISPMLGIGPGDIRLKELMERLDALHNSIRFRVGDIWITCSSGTAVCPADGTDFVSLYKHADKALFKAKRQGKDQNRIYIEENL